VAAAALHLTEWKKPLSPPTDCIRVSFVVLSNNPYWFPLPRSYLLNISVVLRYIDKRQREKEIIRMVIPPNSEADASLDDWFVEGACQSLPYEKEMTQQQQQQQQHHDDIIDHIPPQLHPAVSMGMRRVSSCYFSVRSEGSVGSMADLLSLLEEEGDHHPTSTTSTANVEGSQDNKTDRTTLSSSSSESLLYHDILMNVFEFMDAESLRAVSETSRQMNCEVYHFLSLQLQSALIPVNEDTDDDDNEATILSCIAGVSVIRRLAACNRPKAELIVSKFSSLRQMPLSHSLAYMRQVILQKTKQSPLASAALLVTLLGAASSLPSVEAAQTLFKLFGATATVMGASAASGMGATFRENLQQRATGMAERAFPSWSVLLRMAAHHHYNHNNDPQRGGSFLAPTTSTDEGNEGNGRATPTGCVGAYARTVREATTCMAQHVKESRQAAFEKLPAADRQALATRFLQACTSNDTLDDVKTIVQGGINVDGFFVGNDGTETCALHTAAFNGAHQVVEFLCQGIDDSLCGTCDGGLCDVNLQDSNAWSALHFAAGSNSVDAARILVKYGADWTIEANNGYTPLTWAIRLKHDQVAEEFKKLAAEHNHHPRWMTQRPFTEIASRFFAFVMVQSH
jgi:hypothetical protein